MSECPRCGGKDGAHYSLCVIARLVERIFGPEYPATAPERRLTDEDGAIYTDQSQIDADIAGLRQTIEHVTQERDSERAHLAAVQQELEEWKRIADEATRPHAFENAEEFEKHLEDVDIAPVGSNGTPREEAPVTQLPTPTYPAKVYASVPPSPAEWLEANVEPGKGGRMRGDWVVIVEALERYNREFGTQLTVRDFGQAARQFAERHGYTRGQGPRVGGIKPMVMFGARWKGTESEGRYNGVAADDIEVFLGTRCRTTGRNADSEFVSDLAEAYERWRHTRTPVAAPAKTMAIAKVLWSKGYTRRQDTASGGKIKVLGLKLLPEPGGDDDQEDHTPPSAAPTSSDSPARAASSPAPSPSVTPETITTPAELLRAVRPEFAEPWMQNPPSKRTRTMYAGARPGREMPKEYREVVNKILDGQPGWEYQPPNGRTSKPRIINPDGRKFTLPNTPSDVRGIRNTITQLKRLGALL
jgi:hypothetical protein